MDKKDTFSKENLDAGKEKAKAAAGKVNEKIKGLAFRGILENKVKPETRAKFPILDKLIPITNYIACGVAVLLVVVVVSACFGRGGGGGGSPKLGGKENPATDFKYGLTSDGNGVVIQDYIGKTGGDIVIPSTIEGLPVVEFDTGTVPMSGFNQLYLSKAGKRMTDAEVKEAGKTPYITSIVFPDSITTMGEADFFGNLKSVVLPKKINRIPESMFGGCYMLTYVKMPESVEEIGNAAFKDCLALKSIVLPEGVKKIGEMAFEACEALESVTIPESIERIEGAAFRGCVSLTTVNIPAKQISYGGSDFFYAFLRCSKLSLATRKAIQDTGYKGDF